MHPDAILAALEAELREVQDAPEKDAEREKEIKAEIKRVDDLPRPESRPEDPETKVNHADAYLTGLHVELDEAERAEDKDQIAQIKAEIKRVEKEVDVDKRPSDEEIELRKQQRAGRQVEQAVNQPVPANQPASKGAKE